MDRNLNSAALQQTFTAVVRHVNEPLTISFLDVNEDGQTIHSLVLTKGAGGSPSFRLEFNDPSNACEGEHVAMFELSDLYLRIRFKTDALIRSGSVGQLGRDIVTELVVRFPEPPAQLRKLLHRLEKLALGHFRMRYVGLALRLFDDGKDSRRS